VNTRDARKWGVSCLDRCSEVVTSSRDLQDEEGKSQQRKDFPSGVSKDKVSLQHGDIRD